jgi:hypothetical protein
MHEIPPEPKSRKIYLPGLFIYRYRPSWLKLGPDDSPGPGLRAIARPRAAVG